MSVLVNQAIAASGLSGLVSARAHADRAAIESFRSALGRADLLALGALADQVRASEVGDAVRIHTEAGHSLPTVDAMSDDFGLAFLRRVAIERLLGEHAAPVRVDWVRVGIEIAQVALAFGANELVGAFVTKRGLPIADGAMSGTGKKSERIAMVDAKKQELAKLVQRCGRRAVFVGVRQEVTDSTRALEQQA